MLNSSTLLSGIGSNITSLNYYNLYNVPTGLISSNATSNIFLLQSTATSTYQPLLNSSTLLSGIGSNLTLINYNNLINIPTGLISSNATSNIFLLQTTASSTYQPLLNSSTLLSGIGSNITSLNYNNLYNVPTGLISSNATSNMFLLQSIASSKYLQLSGGSVTGDLILNYGIPNIQWGSSNGNNIAIAGIVGGFSTSAAIGDMVIRCVNNIHILSGYQAPAIKIPTTNIVEIPSLKSATSFIYKGIELSTTLTTNYQSILTINSNINISNINCSNIYNSNLTTTSNLVITTTASANSFIENGTSLVSKYQSILAINSNINISNINCCNIYNSNLTTTSNLVVTTTASANSFIENGTSLASKYLNSNILPNLNKKNGFTINCSNAVTLSGTSYYKYDINLANYSKMLYLDGASNLPYRTFSIKCLPVSGVFSSNGNPNIIQYDIYMSSNISAGTSNVCAIGVPQNINLNQIPTSSSLFLLETTYFNYISVISTIAANINCIIQDYLN